MSRFLTRKEEMLVELVHILSNGNELEYGFTFKETKDWLHAPIKRKGGKNALQCLDEQGASFVEEVRIALGLVVE